MPWTKVILDAEELNQFRVDKNLRVLTYVEALREAHEQLMERDPNVIVMGEGVDDPGGVFGSTLGLIDRFGSSRVMDLPIAENGMTGVAIGAAIAGIRPIFVHMRMDFLPMCMDQIINHAAKWHYMTGGKVNVPLVIRAIIGRGWGSAAQHSQSFYGLFQMIPGIKIIAPATPYDAKGMLIQAVSDGNPVLCVEHRWIYEMTGYVPEESYSVSFGKGVMRKKGTDVTIVGVSQMLYEAMKAAKILKKEGLSAEVIDPRSLVPLDMEIIEESVRRTGRLVVAEPACRKSGIAAEIVCRLAEIAPSLLQKRFRRIGFVDTPTPCSPVLESLYYPGHAQIVSAVKEMM
jgi:pyruvate/2-oxoglutarate/acetoin dehydrogenase E1 component